MSIKAIYFDYNGVLADQETDTDVLIANYLDISTEELENFLDEARYKSPLKPLWNSMRTVEDEKGYLQTFARVILERFKPNHDESNIRKIIDFKMQPTFKLFPWTIYTLERLSKKYKLGILTNARPSRRRYEIEHFGLDKYMQPEMIIISSEVEASKPDPEIYEIAIERANVQPEEIMFCDDKEEYVEGAMDADLENSLLISKTPHTYLNTLEAIDTIK